MYEIIKPLGCQWSPTGKPLPTGPLPTGRQAVPTEGGAGRRGPLGAGIDDPFSETLHS
jgi:hypothetical protein